MAERGGPEVDPARALPRTRYARPPEEVARDLLGCLLVCQRPDGVAAGVIVEVEAYGGEEDPASHASFRRNGVVRAMWGPPGHAYVYLAYGMYPCFNVVTGREGEAGAVLVRALAPVVGRDVMARRAGRHPEDRLASGPGRLGRALGVALDDNGRPLDRPPLWIEPWERPRAIVAGPRVGVARGVDRPWRFGIPGHPALSRPFPS